MSRFRAGRVRTDAVDAMDDVLAMIFMVSPIVVVV